MEWGSASLANRDVQTKTTAEGRNWTDRQHQVLTRRWANHHPWPCWWGPETLQLLWNTLWWFLKRLTVEWICNQSSFLPGYTREKWKQTSTPNTHTYVHNSISHNCQKLQMTQMWLNSTDVQITEVWRAHTVLFCRTDHRHALHLGRTSKIPCYMEESVHKGHVLDNSIYNKCLG